MLFNHTIKGKLIELLSIFNFNRIIPSSTNGGNTYDLYLANIILPGLILITGMLGSILLKKLSPLGAFTGGIIGVFIFLGAGNTGLSMLVLFFITGIIATQWGRKIKKDLFYENAVKTGRTAGQVFANGGIAGLCGLGIMLYPAQQTCLLLMMASSLASATADTLASELGTLYGKNFYNCLTIKKDQKGLDGVISLEGTLIGALGALLIAVIYSLGYGFSILLLIIMLAGIAGNLADSLLGAGFERKGLLKNDQVNFLSTLIAAILAAISYFSFL